MWDICGWAARVTTAALDDKAIRRAASAIAKRGNFVPRPKQFVKLGLVRRMLQAAGSENCFWTKADAMLFLTAYVFLVRVPCFF